MLFSICKPGRNSSSVGLVPKTGILDVFGTVIFLDPLGAALYIRVPAGVGVLLDKQAPKFS